MIRFGTLQSVCTVFVCARNNIFQLGPTTKYFLFRVSLKSFFGGQLIIEFAQHTLVCKALPGFTIMLHAFLCLFLTGEWPDSADKRVESVNNNNILFGM